MKLDLLRIEKTDQGTIGVLLIDKIAFCATLEPEDLNNQENISCIPEGSYICERVNSPKYGNTFEVKNVPNRNHILIHSGNTEDHTMGCILLGQYFGKLRGSRAVLNSGATFKRFLKGMKIKEIDSFKLNIKDVCYATQSNANCTC
ncbi:MAG: DUF5675 family protein [Candidatus Helarchaeota archaeon]